MKTVPFRLSFRVEGHIWNVYATKPDTMEGAIWLGSIAMRFVENNKERRNQFINIMTSALTDIFKELGAEVSEWKMQDAPEHERTRE